MSNFFILSILFFSMLNIGKIISSFALCTMFRIKRIQTRKIDMISFSGIPSCFCNIFCLSVHPVIVFGRRFRAHVLRVELEKGDLINQLSSSFILFIILSFDSVVSSSPYRASYPRMMDSSRIRSHSSFIQSFILSNSIR